MAREPVNVEMRCGEMIERAMLIAHMSQSQLARASGIKSQMICRIVNSKRGANVATFFRLLDACGCTIQLKASVPNS